MFPGLSQILLGAYIAYNHSPRQRTSIRTGIHWTNMTAKIIQALLDARAYDHVTHDIHVLETHISWVVCTGTYAYKIKKPVDLGFLDFSTLEKRRYYCHEELRLNKLLAPELYLDVIAITGTPESPHVNGREPAIEYAVQLKQFDADNQLDKLLAAGKLEERHIDELVQTIIDFHTKTRRIELTGDDRIAATHAPVLENYLQVNNYELSPDQYVRLNILKQWHDAEFFRLKRLIEQRFNDGFIRECHGDLHLGNIVVFQNRIRLFDRLEFDEQLRSIDVINDIAFLLMDLEAHEQYGLAHRFLSAWLLHCGDYTSLYMLNYYKAYRAMVRAKVAIIQGKETDFQRYLNLAESYAKEHPTALLLTHGLSGSGKSTIAHSLAPLINAFISRSDVERKRHLQDVYPELYGTEATRHTYTLLASAAEAITNAGYNAIVDATFLKQQQRQAFLDLAHRLGIPCIILDFQAPRKLLEQWIRERRQAGVDVSDATLAVLDQQIREQQPLVSDERLISLVVDTSRDVDIATLANRVQSRIWQNN